ncbi:MAG: late competence development ComFB family protein [Clostridiaceae bacterium]|nr:late competence development ComFB family protein [Clostridiaceae bacterium]
MILKNYMEEIVYNYMEEVLKDFDMCKCDMCKLDVAAKALNDLPPQYFVSNKGEVYSKIKNLKLQFEVDVITAITRAAELINKNPRHNVNNQI